MSKSKRQKYKPESFETAKPNGHYSRMYDDMVDSTAFKALSSSARTVLIVLKRQFKGNYTGNTIRCPYKDIQAYGLNSTTIKRALSDLEQKGFIKIERGARQTADKNLYRQPNEYTFIDAWKNYSAERQPVGKYKGKNSTS